MDINLITVALYSYLMGSLPFGLILTKIFLQKDIRKAGSGNIGTTNVLRTGNKSLAAVTLALDLLKGYVSVYITLSYYESFVSYSALLCFVGHIFPIWLKFKGGKGVATYLGILFALSIQLSFLFGINLFLGLSFIIFWMIIALISRYSSLSSIVASLIAPIYFFINSNNYISIFLLYLFLIIILKHRENIKRLIKRTENKIKLSK